MTPQSHRASRILLAAAIALTAPAALHAQGSPEGGSAPADEGTAYQDWRHRCEVQEQTGKEICFIAQRLVTKDSDRPVLQVVVGFPPGKDRAVALITVPLGVSLPAGIEVRVDDGETIQVPYGRCMPGGCQAILPLSDALIGSLKRGLKAEMSFQDPAGRSVPVRVSLRGFTAAYEALGE